MAIYNSIYKGSVIDATVSAVIAGKAGIQGVKVNGSELTPDPDTNKVDLSVPNLLNSTGQSTTAGMTQKAITDAISITSGVAGVKVNGVELEKDSANKVDVPVPVLQSTTGSSTTAGMTQSAITTALSSKADSSSLSTVATSGDYDDLSNKPTIPTLLSTTGSSTTEGMTQDAITTELSGKATVSKYTATLSTSWDGSSAPYTQTVSVPGILSTDVPIVDVVLSSTTSTAISQLEAWSCVSKITTSNGSITATCLAEKPTSSIPIQLLVVS